MELTETTDNEKKYPVSSIHSYQPLSTNAAKLLEKMIEHAVDDYHDGHTTHVMSYEDITVAFGLKKTNNRDYIRARLREIQALDVVHWDFLGEDQSFLEQVKKIASEDIDATIFRRAKSPIVQTEKFQELNDQRKVLEFNRLKNSKKYERVLSEILDLLFPLEVGNKKIFEAFDIHKSGISYTINRHLIDLFTDPHTYGILDRTIIYQFRSAYTMNVYRNACLYQYIGATPWLSIDKAKMLLGVEKATDENGNKQLDQNGEEVFLYPTYGSFKQGAIKSALNELKKHFDAGRIPFSVELEEDKSLTPGKRVDAIRFVIKTADLQDSPVIGVPSILDKSDLTITRDQFDEVLQEATELGCNRQAAIEVIKYACRTRSANFDDLKSTLDYCRQQAELKRKRGGHIHGGYVRDAIMNGWTHAGITDSPKKRNEEDRQKEEEYKEISIKDFVKQVTDTAGQMLDSQDQAIQTIVSDAIESNSVLKDLNNKGIKDKKLIASELLRKLSNKEFEQHFGFPKLFKYREITKYF